MRNDLSVLAAGTTLYEIYIVYARLRNALRIIVRIQLSGIAEFAINFFFFLHATDRQVTQLKTLTNQLAANTCTGGRLHVHVTCCTYRSVS